VKLWDFGEKLRLGRADSTTWWRVVEAMEEQFEVVDDGLGVEYLGDGIIQELKRPSQSHLTK